MSIVDSIKKARERGATDEQILREVIKQNPKKEKTLKEALKRNASPTQILEEIIRQNTPKTPPSLPKEKKEEEIRIEEARKRIEALKRQVLEKEKGKISEGGKEERKKEEKEEEKEEERARRIKKEKIIKEQKRRGVIIEEEKRRRELLGRLREPKEEIGKPPIPPPKRVVQIFRPLPKKPTLREKLWVRILVFSLILVLLAGISTFWYWYLVIQKQPPTVGCTTDADCSPDQLCREGVCVAKLPSAECASDADCPAGQICGPEGVCITKPAEIVIPPSLFLVEDTRRLEISSPEELRSLFLQIVQEWQNVDQFRRVVIINTKENRTLSLKNLLDALQIRAPTDFYQKLGDNFTLFIYSQMEGNRIGFVAEVLDKSGLSNLLTSQEATMKDDFKTFFTLMEEESAFTPYPYFRNANQVSGYAGPNFRFQTLTSKDLGICYLTSDYYLVFTSSWKSMEKVIEKLVITGAPVEITTELKVGDKGYEVELLQMWLKQDRDVYPRGLVTGFFGNLTKEAVIRFQEKYASEILAPQGLTRGTGVVDLYTRIKLNELYGRSGLIPPVQEITIDLRFGDHGDEVRLLQTWLAKDWEIYPRGIISGWFGNLTKEAVIRFQEKYASEILAPQGLTRGTGIVDAQTRKKLNELYSKTAP